MRGHLAFGSKKCGGLACDRRQWSYSPSSDVWSKGLAYPALYKIGHFARQKEKQRGRNILRRRTGSWCSKAVLSPRESGRGSQQSSGGMLSVRVFCGPQEFKASPHYQFQKSLSALGLTWWQNGVPTRIWSWCWRGRQAVVFRLERWLQSGGASQGHAQIFHVPPWRTSVLLHDTAVRLEHVTILVHTSYETSYEVDTNVTQSTGFALPRRLPTCRRTKPWRLYRRISDYFVYASRFVTDKSRACSTSWQGLLASWRNNKNRALGCSHGHCTASILHYSNQTRGYTLPSNKPPKSSTTARESIESCAETLFRKVCFKYASYSASKILLSSPIHRPQLREAYSHSSRMPNQTQQTQHKRLEDLEYAVRQRGKAALRRGYTFLGAAHRCVRCGIRRNFGKELGSGFCWRDLRPGHLVTVPAIAVNYFTRVDGDPSEPGGPSPEDPEPEFEPANSASPLRQPGGSFHTGEDGLVQSGADDRATAIASAFINNENHAEGELAANGGEQVRGQAVAHMEPVRVTSRDVAVQLRRGIFEAATMSSGVAAVGGSGGSTSRYDRTVQRVLGRRMRSTMEPTAGVDQSDAAENPGGSSVRSSSSSRLDRAALVRSLAEHDHTLSTRVTQTRSVQRAAQPGLGAAHRGGGLSFNTFIRSSIASQLPDTPSRAATLRLAGNVYANSTDATKTSQWKKFAEFCVSERHISFPASVGACLSYIGFLFEENRVHAASLPGYLSAVRTRHTRANYPDPFAAPAARDLVRAFAREDDARGTHTDVRMGLSSSIMYRIHCLGMEAAPGSQVEFECALVEMQFLLSWREHSIRDMCVSDVSFASDSAVDFHISIQVHPRSLKGQPIRGAVPSTLTCKTMVLGAAPSNGLDLQVKYAVNVADRDASSPYWLSPSATWPTSQCVTRALDHLLGLLGIAAPDGCYYASHSLRSGSVTTLVLLGVPMPVIIQRGRWTSERMVTNVYFDARLVSSEHSWFYFSILVPSVHSLPLS